MQQLWLDGRQLETNGVISWGDLLESLESKHLAEGHIIKSVSFNGEDLAEFRGVGIEQTRVDTIERVDISSVDVTDYIRELVAESSSHLDGIVRVLSDASILYRRQHESDGAARLHAALKGLDTLMQIVQTVTNLAGWDLQTFELSSGSAGEGIDQLATVLEGVVRHQEQGDTSRLAATIEDELIPGLALWGSIIQEIQTRLTPSAAK